jgi:hypothetical protein
MKTRVKASGDILEKHLERKLDCACQFVVYNWEFRKDALKRQLRIDFERG